MARLSIRLLGPFQVSLNSEPLTRFESDKVRALLAYLALEADRPHRRESLVGLLWPDFSERSARANLRGALANLRRLIGDHEARLPYLRVSRQALQFNTASDAWVDVLVFERCLAEREPAGEAIPALEQAVALYRADFLEGFSLPDSPAFEEWALLTRERFHRLALEALRQLADGYEERGSYGTALRHARRMLDLDALLESAHRQVMRLLACSGERGAALAQYEECRRLLRQELDVPPARETQRLFRQIRAGEWDRAPRPSSISPAPSVGVPAFLQEGSQEQGPVVVPSGYTQHFVARERELRWLNGHLARALAGEGRVAFVVGGPGRGKTLLLQVFARRAMAAHDGLLVAGGNGNAYSGVGDPYLPFREVLDMLSGDVEARWAAGSIEREHALRLWGALPDAAQALLESGPDLIDTFLPGRALLDRVAAHADTRAAGEGWGGQLAELVARRASLPPDPNLQQSALFKQYTRVLSGLARRHPLLLLLDDLQWVDSGSAGLLFHLGRDLAGCHIMILGAYRPEEVGGSKASGRHPLEGALAEFRRRHGDVWLDLGQTEARERRRFTEVLLDSEPNHLGTGFRDALYRRTEGHPLFTAELLHTMQERGDLVREAETDAWVQGGRLDWGALPPKVEGAIAARIERLAPDLRELLAVASVEGEEFTAQVVARVLGMDERAVIRQLSGPLEGQHRLVRAQGVRRLGGQWLSQHRFRHNLFQAYLYGSLNGVERAYLHRDVGEALEGLYAGHAEELAAIAPQLARHFQAAGMPEKAIEYLRQAGERARRMSADAEAVDFYLKALELLEGLPDIPQRVQRELMLQVGLSIPLQNVDGYASARLARVLARARELCEEAGGTSQLFPVLAVLTNLYGTRAEYRAAHETGERFLNLAKRLGEPGSIMWAHMLLGWPLVLRGQFQQALSHLQQVMDVYDVDQHQGLAYLYGIDTGVTSRSWSSLAFWFLGYPDRAFRLSQQALALAQELMHPSSQALALAMAGSYFFHFYRDVDRCQQCAKKCLDVSVEHGLPMWLSAGHFYHGWTRVQHGQFEEGIAELREGTAILRATGSGILIPHHLALLADAYGGAGRPEEGLPLLHEAVAIAKRTGEGFAETEIHCLTGDLLQMVGADADEVEHYYHKTLKVARGQHARSWELRATMRLARLWQAQGKRDEARERLAQIYGWFTEGFDTPDLQEARALLESLG